MPLTLLPLIRRLSIVDKDGFFEPFPIDAPTPGERKPDGTLRQDDGWAQRILVREVEKQYNSGRPVRIIVLKARQLGLSTIAAAIVFCWLFIHRNNSGLVVAHENDIAELIFDKSVTYWEHGPWRKMYQTTRDTAKKMEWNNGSALRIATARNLGAGHGRTIQALHTTEASRYLDPEPLMLGLRQSLAKKHGTIEIVESTAHGVGDWFHSQWMSAEEGESDYKPLFFPWQKHPSYRLSTTLCTELELDPEERRLLLLGASYEHIEWRRSTLINDCNNDEEYFRQEYPATPMEAFLAAGENLFNLRHLESAYDEETRFFRGRLFSSDPGGRNPVLVQDDNGPLTIYRRPIDRLRDRPDLYFVGADPSRTPTGDPGCIQVINRATYEQVAVWHGNVDPHTFAHEMMMLGHFYHGAMLCPEVEGGGQQVIALLIDKYEGAGGIWMHRLLDKAGQGKVANTYGYAQNWNRKNAAISAVQYLLGQHILTLHDVKTVHQMQIYVRTSPYEFGPADHSDHDDAVMALSIAVFCSMTEDPFTEQSLYQAQALDIYAMQGR